MRYTWREKKNRRNLGLHGISFADAAGIFDGPTVERIDDRFDYGETRIYAIVLVNGREITVIYADRKNNERRIISAWRSEPHERRHYWRNLDWQDNDWQDNDWQDNDWQDNDWQDNE